MRYQLTGAGFVRERLAQLAQSWGLLPPSQDQSDPDDAGAAIAVMEPGDAHEMERILRQRLPVIGLIEYGKDHARLGADLVRNVRPDGFYLCLTTGLAWSVDLAAQFCDALVLRGWLPVAVRYDVEVALHEAVINAALHGNLGLGRSLVSNPEEFDSFCQLLTMALADPGKAEKRLRLAAWRTSGRLFVKVSDEGQGYDPARLPSDRPLDAKSGRGLDIMRVMSASMRVMDEGRSVLLEFAV
jgi:Histidine kinase-like ATPase domain